MCIYIYIYIYIYIQPTYLCSTTVFQHLVLLILPLLHRFNFFCTRTKPVLGIFRILCHNLPALGSLLFRQSPPPSTRFHCCYRSARSATSSPQHRGLTSPSSSKLSIYSPTSSNHSAMSIYPRIRNWTVFKPVANAV